MNTNPDRLAGWSAILSAIATLLGFVTLIGFFMAGGLFGVVNDAISAIGSLAIIPILFALYRLHRSHAPAASLGALVIGIVAMLVAAILQALLVFKVIAYEQTAVPVPFSSIAHRPEFDDGHQHQVHDSQGNGQQRREDEGRRIGQWVT